MEEERKKTNDAIKNRFRKENYNQNNNYNISCYKKMILSSLNCLSKILSLIIILNKKDQSQESNIDDELPYQSKVSGINNDNIDNINNTNNTNNINNINNENDINNRDKEDADNENGNNDELIIDDDDNGNSKNKKMSLRYKKIQSKNFNYSHIGEASAKKYLYLIDKKKHLNNLLKGKKRNKIVEADFIDQEEKDIYNELYEKDEYERKI